MTEPTLPQRAATQLVEVMGHYLRTLDLAIPGSIGAHRAHPSQIEVAASSIVAALVDPDPAMQHEGLISLIPWIDPPGLPVAPDWWTTPIGLLAAAAQDHDDDDDDGWVTQSQAADALGVTPETVSRWASAGRLDSRPGGPTGGRLVSRRQVSRMVLDQEEGKP